MAMVAGGRVIPKNKAARMRAQAVASRSGTRAMRSSPAQYLSFGGILKGIGGAIGGFATGGIPGLLAGGLGGRSGKGSTTPCPPGFTVGRFGCEAINMLGGLPAVIPQGPQLPAGGTFNQGGQTTVGAFGMPASLPDIVGVVEDRDGVRQPIRRCGKGMVLGKDDLCYPKQVLGARGKWRKHPQAQRAPVTAADAKAIRQATSARNRVKKLAGDVGFAVKKK